MIFYLIPTAAGEPAKLEPTQDMARATCKVRGLKFNAGEMQHDVPTDKAALLDYVNGLLAQRYAAAAEGVETFYRGMDAGAAQAKPKPTGPTAPAAPTTSFESGQIVEFILDRATVAQVENVFAAIGTRFAEARKAA